MKYKKIIINGLFFTQALSGAQRYAIEMIRAMDEIVPSEYMLIAVPKGFSNNYIFKNIKVKEIGHLQGRLWEQLDLFVYAKKQKSIILNFCNTAPVLSPGIMSILDVGYRRWKEIPEVGSTRRKRFFRNIQNFFYINYSKILFTLTESSKSDIIKYFRTTKRVNIVGCGWEHYNKIQYDDSVFNVFSRIIPGTYYFVMSNLSEHKNFKWVLEVAKKNKDNLFVISGAYNPRHFVFNDNLSEIKNVLYIGRVTDSQAKSLMKQCKAFLYPSLYEGFGLPPLEALSVGIPIIVSNIPSHREIYGRAAYYINPREYDYKLDDLLNIPINQEEVKRVLFKNTWMQAANRLYTIIKEYNDEKK